MQDVYYLVGSRQREQVSKKLAGKETATRGVACVYGLRRGNPKVLVKVGGTWVNQEAGERLTLEVRAVTDALVLPGALLKAKSDESLSWR